MRTMLLVGGSVFLGAGGLGFFLAPRAARKVKLLQREDLDVSEVKPGTVKVLGLVQAPAAPLEAPFSRSPCVWYHVLVQELVGSGNNRRWATVYEEARGVPFHLKDRKGPATVEVDLAGAEVALAAEGGTDDFATLDAFLVSRGKTPMFGRGQLRANETTLTAGEKIFVAGTCAQRSTGQLALERRDGQLIVSDQESGQIGYRANTAMYLTRLWAGVATAVGAWLTWRGI
jgi:hypothetical protein